jgi:fido (protein-threonine AMPylation protein)
MDLPADLLHLFDHLRAGRARRSAAAWAQAGRLEVCLPAVNARGAFDGPHRRSAWLHALDEWHYRQGGLSVSLLLASRLWSLGAGPDAAAAFPCLSGRADLTRWVDSVLRAQADLDARHADAWAAWPPALRLEALRLMRWRELIGERAPGEAARCHAALAGIGPDTAATGHVCWPDAPSVLTGSAPLASTVEEMLLGWAVPAVREPADTALACVVAALRLRGHPLRLTDLQGEWPIPNAGLTLGGWQRLGRRVGLTVTAGFARAPASPGGHRLAQRRDGRCLLLLGDDRAYAPGELHPFRQLRPGALTAADVALRIVLSGPGSADLLWRRPLRRLRLQTLTGDHWRGASADPARLRDLQTDASRWPDVQAEPPPLDGLALADLLAAHRRLGPAGSPFHGHFRRVDLHASTALLAWAQIPAAMDALVARLAARPPAGDVTAHARALAAVFMDFLRIHPFLNGNRRVAMSLARVWAAREGWRLDWTGLSRLQLHHAVRCAAAGHSGPLVQALATRLHRPAGPAG